MCWPEPQSPIPFPPVDPALVTVDGLLSGKADEQPRTAMLFILWMYVLSLRHYFLINVHTGKQINQKDLKQALFVLHEQTAIALCLNLIVKNEQFW